MVVCTLVLVIGLLLSSYTFTARTLTYSLAQQKQLNPLVRNSDQFDIAALQFVQNYLTEQLQKSPELNYRTAPSKINPIYVRSYGPYSRSLHPHDEYVEYNFLGPVRKQTHEVRSGQTQAISNDSDKINLNRIQLKQISNRDDRPSKIYTKTLEDKLHQLFARRHPQSIEDKLKLLIRKRALQDNDDVVSKPESLVKILKEFIRLRAMDSSDSNREIVKLSEKLTPMQMLSFRRSEDPLEESNILEQEPTQQNNPNIYVNLVKSICEKSQDPKCVNSTFENIRRALENIGNNNKFIDMKQSSVENVNEINKHIDTYKSLRRQDDDKEKTDAPSDITTEPSVTTEEVTENLSGEGPDRSHCPVGYEEYFYKGSDSCIAVQVPYTMKPVASGFTQHPFIIY